MGCIRAIRMLTVFPAGIARVVIVLSCSVLAPLIAGGCVKGHAATDTGDPGFPFGPSAVSTRQLAYIPDVKPILDRDCLSCHRSDGRGEGDRAGGYSVSTYADVMAGQRPGDAKSSLVRTCAPGGSMYRYFNGDAQTSATVLFRWLVYYDAAQTR
jgi:hypothetical protein